MDAQMDAWVDAEELKALARRRLQAQNSQQDTAMPGVWGWVHTVLLVLALGVLGLAFAAPACGWVETVEDRNWVPASGWRGGAR